MDALMAAIVLGAITQATDRTPWLAAILADRFGSRALVLAAAALAFAVNYGLGVVAGLAIGGLLTPEAKLLLLAMALVLAGLGTGWRTTAPDGLSGWRVGRVMTTVGGLFITAFGDRMQFIAAALATRSPLPWAAAAGALIGALAICAVAIVLGEEQWRALPHRGMRIAAAVVLTIAGIVIALNAVSLI